MHYFSDNNEIIHVNPVSMHPLCRIYAAHFQIKDTFILYRSAFLLSSLGSRGSKCNNREMWGVMQAVHMSFVLYIYIMYGCPYNSECPFYSRHMYVHENHTALANKCTTEQTGCTNKYKTNTCRQYAYNIYTTCR